MKLVYNFDDSNTPLWIKILFFGLYMVLFIVAVRKTMFGAPRDKRQVKVGGFVLLYFIVYAMFYCVNPDYFSYREWMFIPDFNLWTREQVYAYIIMFCQSLNIGYSYELFRLIVWGGGLLLVLYTAKRYRSLMTPELVILILFVLYSGTYSYGRVSLAMAVYFMGVSVIMWGKNGLVKLLGIALAVCSYFFHHQLIIGIGLLPGIIFPFEKKRTLFFSVVLLAMMMGVIYYINSNVSLMESVFGADELAEKMETYNEREQGAFRLSTSVMYLNIFVPFLFVTLFFFEKENIPKPILGIFRVTFIFMMATIAFFVISGPRSTYTYRVLYLNIIPISILVTYCYNQGYFKNYHLAIMFLLAILTNSLRLINSVQ